jgi:DNA-binding NarL/FixJ family response regulator|tara:strand:- start:675 stop:1343 length:669 start_codon:yes stop_codon:yes gene_type:complete
MNEIIKIALVEDEALLVEGFSSMFLNVENILVVKTANNRSDFLNVLEETSKSNFPDIALVDFQMKPMNGFELVEVLREKHPNLKIIILYSHYKSNVLGHMIKLGVSAFIPKSATKKLLIEAIESVNDSGIYFTQTDQEMLTKYMSSRSKKVRFTPNEVLSKRENEILKLICLEYTNQEIGHKLFISKRTVENHRQKILGKIGAKNTVGLVVYAIANDIHSLT